MSGSSAQSPAQSAGEGPRFGDLLALARLHWVGQMAAGLERRGYPDYRRSDAGAVRTLLGGPVPVGQVGRTLAVSRQAARKVVDGLERRGLVTTSPDGRDGRRVTVTLTPAGEEYARAVVATIDELHAELARQVSPDDLATARAVLAGVARL
jgi:DNA-binding MarR family transcriptional regulator